MRKVVLAFVIGIAAPGCDGGGAQEPRQAAPDAGDHHEDAPGTDAADGPDADAPTAAAAGLVVDVDGEPVAGAAVLACTALTCFTTEAGEDGAFFVDGLPVVDHKMQVVGETLGLASVLYHQKVVAGEVVTAPRPIVLSPLDAESVPWTTAEGGAITIAGGRLRLTAEAGVVKYPLGHFDQSVRGAFVRAEDLPPLDVEPWIGHEAGTLAFTVSPEPVTAKSGAFQVEVLGLPAEAAGTTYRVYGVDSDTAELRTLGRAEAGADGILALTEGAVTQLTTLIFVPDGP